MEFWLAFAFGAGVLWLFASDQFNHPSWTNDERLTRILSVPDLRGARVRRRALFVYLLLLFVVYTVFVFFAGVIVLAADEGLSASTAGGGAAKPLALPGPSVPFAVSLAMVGIAPRIELLTRLEAKIREAAHVLMGLPRGLFSSGQAIADADLSLDDIGRENILPEDLERLSLHVEAAREVFGPQAVRVKLFERRLLKLLAYKVWVADGLWPSTETREPYELLEADFATDLSACYAELDSIAATPAGGSNADRDALRKRWSDRLRALEGLCGEVCTLMFIYSEKEDPDAKRPADPLHRSIAGFFRKAVGERAKAPELDIAIRSILLAVAIAGVWGFIGVMLRPVSGLSAQNPAVIALIAAIGALFQYGPAILVAFMLDNRIRHATLNTTGALLTFILCLCVSLLFLASLNVAQAVVQFQVAGGAIVGVAYAALLVEAPMAALGAIQGVFILKYFEAYRGPRQPDAGQKWRLIALNVATMLLASVVATYLVVAAFEVVGRWHNPTFARLPALSDFVSRVPTAGLIALVIGLVISLALGDRSDARDVETKGVTA